MIRSSLLTASAVAVMCGTAFGGDYLFPSATPPAGKSAKDVTQFVTFIWDDNGYSGEKGTTYETTEYMKQQAANNPEAQSYIGIVGGPYHSSDDLKIKENQMGLAWAVNTLGPKLNKGHMTFNMISGLFIPAWGKGWDDRESEYGYTKDDANTMKRIAITWGREQKLGTNEGQDDQGKPFMVNGVSKMVAAGHEIGNHTVDHLETNSIWPKSLWPNGGDGFDATGKEDILGGAWDEKEAGYSDSTSSRGWMKYAGKKLQGKTWEDIITLGEQDGPKQGIKAKLFGFRAPRLEINSNMFYALSAKKYLYDCGVEEGLEANRDGSNFLWPYTTDNGIPNFSTQETNGEKLFVDSLPYGLWEIPVNEVVVPDSIRKAVFATYTAISKAGGEDVGKLEEWDGKVTGFDFNMFILFGMTKSQALATLKNTFDLHYNGNRSPMQIGCHTDYFTPMYDLATLSKDKVYKLALAKNKWTDRKATWEEFADYASKKDGGSKVKFVTGKELIDSIKAMQNGYEIPKAISLSSEAKWYFVKDELGSTDNAGADNFKGDSFKGDITLKPSDEKNDKYAAGSYVTDFNEGQLKGLSHISFNYKSNTAFAVRVYVEGDTVKDGISTPWEVILNNKGRDVESGAIPISAFGYGEYNVGTKTAIDVTKIQSIEFAPLGDNKQCTFDVTGIKLHGAKDYATAISGIAGASTSAFKVACANTNTLNVSVPKTGTYTVQIFTAAGRLVRSINARKLNAGVNSVNMNTLTSGVYMVKISGEGTSFAAKALVM